MKIRLLSLLTILVLTACTSPGSNGVVNTPLAKLKQQALQGDAEGQYRLGVRYTNGSGVTQNYATAARWFNEASIQGHQGAEYMLAIAYSTGRGIPARPDLAVGLFTRAAKSGHARSQYQLGEIFANARGVPKDLKWASRWYEKAARQKHAEALFSLGAFRAAGIDGAPDPEQAWVWLQLAAGLKHPQAAEVRDRIAAHLSAASLTRAKDQARNWVWSSATNFADQATVRYVQRALNELGFKAGFEDGLIGPRTSTAVSDFRKSKKTSGGSSINDDLVALLHSLLQGQ